MRRAISSRDSPTPALGEDDCRRARSGSSSGLVEKRGLRPSTAAKLQNTRQKSLAFVGSRGESRHHINALDYSDIGTRYASWPDARPARAVRERVGGGLVRDRPGQARTLG